jgi:methenyltetrahydromethanopterin cyclohydrolase
MLIINNAKTGHTFRAGKMNVEALKESFTVSGTVL